MIDTNPANLPGPQTERQLRRVDLEQNPFKQFEKWLAEALAAQVAAPDAMTLATATKTGYPSARTVLLRKFDEDGFVFYTNYTSQKAQELAENPNAALTFYWPELHRQVRVAGQVERVSPEESDEYFQSRPRQSCLGAWASEQSQVISSREVLEKRLTELTAEFEGQDVRRPPFWGGYRLRPLMIEFWQGRANRLHDRFRYNYQAENSWLIERLSP